MTTHCRPPAAKPSDLAIDGSATLTTVASRMTMNWATLSRTITDHGRRPRAAVLLAAGSRCPPVMVTRRGPCISRIPCIRSSRVPLPWLTVVSTIRLQPDSMVVNYVNPWLP